MQIIEDLGEFEAFLRVFQNSPSFVIPIFSDVHRHSVRNPLCLLAVKTMGETYILPYCHNEASNLPGDTLTRLTTSKSIYTPFKKVLSHVWQGSDEIVDIAGIHHLSGKALWDTTKFYPKAMKMMLSKFYQLPNVIRAVPMMVLIEFIEQYMTMLEEIVEQTPIPSGFPFHNNVVLPATLFMEGFGVAVDNVKIINHFGSKVERQIIDDYVYSDYNPYTTAGRVTNHHGKLNFAALKKSNGERECFVSRFERGSVMLIDFEGFHVRLIAQMVGFPLPSESVHEYFGKQYFNTTELTPEQYVASKTKTMEMLYGDEKETTTIPFFKHVNSFIDTLWTKAQTMGYVTSSSGREIWLSRMENPYPAKLFNYLLQMTETEVAMQAIYDLQEVFRGKESAVTLYTYDSILIDFSFADGAELVYEIIKVLENEGRYPVRIYTGPNYNEQTNVTTIVKKANSGI